MIRKIFKWAGGILFVLTVAASIFYVKAYFAVKSRMSRVYDVPMETFTLRSDSMILLAGKRYTQVCKDCHGSDFGGKVWLHEPLLGKIPAPNLTKGRGGLPEDYSVRDWLLALRHGLRRDMTPLIVMPAHETAARTEEDLNAIIAYCSQLPLVESNLPKIEIGFLGYILADLDKINLLPAEKIDHTKPLIRSIKREVSVEFGKYLAMACEGCHRSNMKGGPPLAPGHPVVVDISSTGHVGNWSEEQFLNTIRTGNTPEGKHLDPSKMPWTSFKDYTDIELKAIFKFLKSIK